jgi:hypothetical protein
MTEEVPETHSELELLNELLQYITEYKDTVELDPENAYKVKPDPEYTPLYNMLVKDYALHVCSYITPDGVIWSINKSKERLEKIASNE